MPPAMMRCAPYLTERWRAMVPEELRPGCHDSLLRGMALVEKAPDGRGLGWCIMRS